MALFKDKKGTTSDLSDKIAEILDPVLDPRALVVISSCHGGEIGSVIASKLNTSLKLNSLMSLLTYTARKCGARRLRRFSVRPLKCVAWKSCSIGVLQSIQKSRGEVNCGIVRRGMEFYLFCLRACRNSREHKQMVLSAEGGCVGIRIGNDGECGRGAL